ncbi:hypothetical protein ACFV98_05335 [Streptomyces violascens]|uniref:hypothetical protein n=1 Tax=Streptomyces violascens TaxID=67381 RepID=UPI0036643082
MKTSAQKQPAATSGTGAMPRACSVSRGADLDHDLGDDSIMPVVTLPEEAAFNGRPFDIGAILVHSANPIGGETVVRSLTYWNYRIRRATA